MSLESYEFSDAATAVYAWWQYQLCDVFIETIKPFFSGNDPKFATERAFTRDTLWVCLDNGLRLLHPFMPYVTEELWQRLPSPGDYKRASSIMMSDYPLIIESWKNERVEFDMSLIELVVKSLRSLAQGSRERRQGFVLCRASLGKRDREAIWNHQLEIKTLANVSSLTVIDENNAAPTRCAVSVVNENLSVYLKLHASGSPETDSEKIRKRIEYITCERERLSKILNMLAAHKDKVPEKVTRDTAGKLESLEKENSSLEESGQLMETQAMKFQVSIPVQ